MDKKESKLKFYYGRAVKLIISYEGKNLIGKIVRNRQDIRNAYIEKVEELLLKMIDIDENSSYVKDIRVKLYGDLGIKRR